MNGNYDDIIGFLSRDEQEDFVKCYKEYIEQKQNTPTMLNPKRVKTVLEHYKKLKIFFLDKNYVDIKYEIPFKIDNTCSVLRVIFFKDSVEWDKPTWLINILEDSDAFDIACLSDGSIELIFGFNDTGILASEVSKK